jgi:hypothetical protein
VYRFDDPEPGRAGAFGCCYTASSVEVAFAESVIHESGRFVGGSYAVPAAELTERSAVRFACQRRKTLVLADLTGAALKSLGLNNDISASANYTASQAWAQATHDASARWNGIRYVSRQMNKGLGTQSSSAAGCSRFAPRSSRRGRWTSSAIGSTSPRCDQASKQS